MSSSVRTMCSLISLVGNYILSDDNI